MLDLVQLERVLAALRAEVDQSAQELLVHIYQFDLEVFARLNALTHVNGGQTETETFLGELVVLQMNVGHSSARVDRVQRPTAYRENLYALLVLALALT